MRTIGELTCIWRATVSAPAPAPIRMAKYFPDHVRIDPADRDGLIEAVSEAKSDWIVVIDEDLLPHSTLPLLPLDEDLVRLNLPFSHLSRNVVTYEYDATHGVCFWPRALLLDRLQTDAPIVLPEICAPVLSSQWYCNPTPRVAMENGFLTVARALQSRLDDDALQALTLTASLGADAQFGASWMIGCYHAMLGASSITEIVHKEADTETSPAKTQARADALARRVRLEGTFDVVPLTAAESSLIKDTIFSMPPVDHFLKIADDLERQSKGNSDTAALYRDAAQWNWGRRSA